MATADDYAAWIVKNAAKKGTPEFDTVSKAYQSAKVDPATAPKASEPEKPPPPRSTASKFGGALAAIPEASAHLGTEMLAFPVEGAASLGAMALAPSGQRVRSANQAIESVSNAMVYQPQTPEGAAVSKGVDTVIGTPGRLADKAGQKVTDVTGSAGAGAATSLVLQAIPAVLGGQGISAIAKTSAGAKAAAAASEAVQRAKTYVSTRTGLDWNALGPEYQKKLAQIAVDAKNLDNLDPKAVERVARAKSLDLPISRGQATRNLGQITQEENLQRSEAGQPLRDIQSQQDIGLHKKLGELRPAGADTRAQVGESVQGAARAKYQALKKDYQAKYKAARESGETRSPVSTTALEDWLSVPANARNSGYLKSALQEYKDSVSRETGPEKVSQIRINDLEEIRKEVNAASQSSDGTTRHFAGEAKKVIDGILDQAGGDLYKKARQSFKATKDEFDRQSLVKKLVTEKGKSSDRAVALEDTFDTVVRSGSKDQLSSLIKSLKQGGTTKTRAMGAKAVSDLQAATIDYLREKAAGRRGVTGEQEQLQFNSSFIDAVDELDKDGKLDVLFGGKATSALRELRAATRDLRTKPADRIAGPNTTPRLIAALEKLSKVPILGDIVGGAAKAVGKLHQMGKEGREVKEAATNPVDSAASKAKKPKNTIGMLGRGATLAPATVRDQ